jgi:hypothetical protein
MIHSWTGNKSMTGAITEGEALILAWQCYLTHAGYNPHALRSNNHNTEVKTGPSKNRETHFVTLSGEINQCPNEQNTVTQNAFNH